MERRSWVIGGHVDWILILADASCGNFPRAHAEEEIRSEMSSPLLPRRFELPAIEDGVSCLWRQKTDSRRADSLSPCAGTVCRWCRDTTRLRAWKRKEREKAGAADDVWSRRSRETNCWLICWKCQKRQQQKDRDLFDNVYPGEEKISCTLKRSVPSPVFFPSFFLLFRTLRWCSLIPICN